MAITVAAGQRLTAANVNAFVPMYLSQGSDQSITTTASNHNTFTSLSFGAGETWVAEMWLDVGNASTTLNFRPTYVVTGGLTIARVFMTAPASGETSATSAANSSHASRANNVQTNFGIPTSTTDRALVRIGTVITTTTSGTFTLQVATSTGTATGYTGSVFIAHRVS